MADHLVEDDRLGAGDDRREQPARLDLAELRRVADQHQLGVGGAGVVDQPRQRRRVDHPGLVDQQDRAATAAGRRPRSSSPSRRATLVGVEALGAKDVGGAPGRRRHPQPDPGVRPRLGGGDGGEGLAGAGLADHDDELLPARGQPLDHRPLVGLDRRAGGEDAGDRRPRRPRRGRRVAAIARAAASASRSISQIRSVVKRGPLAVSPTAITESSARKASAISSTSAAGAPAGSWSATAWIASRRSKWEARAVSASARSEAATVAGSTSRSRSKVRRIVSRSRPISSAFERQRSRRLSSVRSRSFARRVVEGGDLAGAGGGVGRGGGEDLRAPGREGAEVVGIEALDLGDAVGDLLPADAEPAGQLPPQVRLVDVAGGLRVVVDRRVVEPGPAAVRPTGRVGDEDVGVELGVAGAGGAVEVGGGEEAVAPDEFVAAVAAPGPAGLALHVVERGGDGGAVGGGDLGPGALAAERPGERDRLRRREGEVEAGDRAAPGDVAEAERLAGRRVAAGQHRGQALGVDLAVEAQVDGGGAGPVALGLTAAGVVVLGAFGDPFGVVALLAGAELPDGEHQRGCPGGGRDPSRACATPLTAGGGGVCIGSWVDSTTWLSAYGFLRIRRKADRS